MAIELEVARAVATDEAFPDGDLAPRQVVRQLRVGPRVAVAPVKPRSNVVVKGAIRLDRDPIAPNEANVAGWS